MNTRYNIKFTNLFFFIAILSLIICCSCSDSDQIPSSKKKPSSISQSKETNELMLSEVSPLLPNVLMTTLLTDSEPLFYSNNKTKAEENKQQKSQTFACTNAKVDNKIASIKSTSTFEQLEAVNGFIKSCVPTASTAKQLEWLQKTNQMYNAFINVERNQDDYDTFDSYMYSLENNPAASENEQLDSQALFHKLPERDQYLLKNLDRANLTVQYVGEGYYNYHWNTKYAEDMFVPYLPPEDAEFIGQLAKDNNAILYNDAAIAISHRELMERTIFWESYLHKYPSGKYNEQAKQLFDQYHYLLFYGSDNTSWTDDFYTTVLGYEEEYLEDSSENIYKRYQQLSTYQLKNAREKEESQIAVSAQRFLNFLEMPQNERNKRYPVDGLKQDTGEIDEWQLAREQFKQAVPIKNIYTEESFKFDCSSGVTCVEKTEN